MKLKNIILGLKSQMPLKRFLKNFLITGTAFGWIDKRSHFNADGSLKIAFSEKSARKAVVQMEKKTGLHFSCYKCIYCDGWHIGKNTNNTKCV